MEQLSTPRATPQLICKLAFPLLATAACATSAVPAVDAAPIVTSSHAPIAAPASNAASLPPVAQPELPLQAQVEAILNQHDSPIAAVLFSPQREVLAFAGHAGADPASQALRPGSTIKPLLTLIAARQGIPTAGPYTCTGRFEEVAGFTCFGQHGALDLPHAIEQSCNTYFFNIAYQVGYEPIRAGLLTYGFGQTTGLAPGEAVSAEVPGQVPSRAELLNLRRARDPSAASSPDPVELEKSSALLLGTGHGPLQVTLLQLTSAYAKLASELQAPVAASVEAQVLDGLRRVVQSETGTGHAANAPGQDVAGKTGAAEAGDYVDSASEKGPENGWFVGFAPARHPRLIVGVLTLRSGGAGKSAAPVAGELLELGLNSVP